MHLQQSYLDAQNPLLLFLLFFLLVGIGILSHLAQHTLSKHVIAVKLTI